MLLYKPFYERGTGYILPKCDGPYQIIGFPGGGSHTVALADALTAEPYDHGKPVSISRLVKFEFPLEYSLPASEDVTPDSLLASLHPRQYVVVAYQDRYHVGMVSRILREEGQVEVQLYQVPKTSRYGPWERRTWAPMLDQGSLVRELVPIHEVVCQVELENDALTKASLERLSSHGIGASGSAPRREKALQTRRR